MRRSVSPLAILVLAFVSLAATTAVFASNATAPAPEQRTTPEKVTTVAPTGEFAYGPILATDPAVRGQIKKLYHDQFDFNQASMVRLQEISQQANEETDGDLRMVLQREGMQIKEDVQLKNVEFGLQIARLNGDTQRVADYEKALDQLTHPEKYMPATLDPALAQQRRAGQN